MNTTTKLASQAAAALSIVAALGEAIQALGSIPSGHLYARVSGKLTLAQYQQAIALLVRAGVVSESPNCLLTWVGPGPVEPR